MSNLKTVQQSFNAARQGLAEIKYGLNLLKALSMKVITNDTENPDNIGKIEDFIKPKVDGDAAASGKWSVIVDGLVDIFTKMELRGVGSWNEEGSSPATENESLTNSFDFLAGFYSSYKVSSTVSIGNVSLDIFVRGVEGTLFNELDTYTQIDAVNKVIAQLEEVVSIYSDLGCDTTGY